MAVKDLLPPEPMARPFSVRPKLCLHPDGPRRPPECEQPSQPQSQEASGSLSRQPSPTKTKNETKIKMRAAFYKAFMKPSSPQLCGVITPVLQIRTHGSTPQGGN